MIVQTVGHSAPPSNTTFLIWTTDLLNLPLKSFLFLQVEAVTTLLPLPSTSRPCDLIQGNSLIFLVWWGSLFVALGQNIRPYHAYGLYGSDNTCSDCAYWGLPSFFPATLRKDRLWFALELAQAVCSMECNVDFVWKGLLFYLGLSYLPSVPSLDEDLT